MKEHFKDSFDKILQKTWYTHNMGLFYMEAIGVKSLALLTPEFRSELLKASSILNYAGALASFEDAYLATRTKIKLGEHMSVRIGHYRHIAGRELSDGNVVSGGAKVGVIDFMRNMPTLDKHDNLISLTRDLFDSAQTSLIELAKLCNSEDPRLEDINTFYGVSHLAGPLAVRLGFDVFDIRNPIDRSMYKMLGKGIVTTIAKKNSSWQRLKSNFKDPREAFISRQRLINLYGEI
jgi:hypothetical protein